MKKTLAAMLVVTIMILTIGQYIGNKDTSDFKSAMTQRDSLMIESGAIK